MFQHKRLAKLIKKQGAKEVSFPMGAFGAPTPKPTKFVGTSSNLESYGVSLTSAQKEAMKEGAGNLQVSKKIRKSDGSTGFTGGPDLKGTQSYPGGIGSQTGLNMVIPIDFPSFEKYDVIDDSDASSGNASDLDCLDDLF